MTQWAYAKVHSISRSSPEEFSSGLKDTSLCVPVHYGCYSPRGNPKTDADECHSDDDWPYDAFLIVKSSGTLHICLIAMSVNKELPEGYVRMVSFSLAVVCSVEFWALMYVIGADFVSGFLFMAPKAWARCRRVV